MASSVPVGSPCHELALTPKPNDVYWFMIALDVGSSDFPAKRNIWLVSDWSPECKHLHLEREWRAEPCPRQSREWTSLTVQKHSVKCIFIFGPSSPASLSCVPIQAVTHAKAQNFHTSRLALNRARHPDGSNPCPSSATMHTTLPGYPMSAMCQPQLHRGQLAPTLLSLSWLPKRRGPLPLQLWNMAFAADVYHPLTEPHLSKHHRGVQSKSSLKHTAFHDYTEMVHWKLSTRSFY